MRASRPENSQRTAASVAAVSGLVAMVIVVFANYGLLNPLMVPGNAAETARNVVAQQTQFRLVVVCFLTYSAIVVVQLAALYVILKSVNQGLALIGALLRFVFALFWLLTTLNMLGALRFLSSTSYRQVFRAEQLQAIARAHLSGNFDDYYVGLPFFGLAATVCAYLWFRSQYIPKGLAAFGLISSAWCVICALIFLIFPNFEKPVNPYWFDSPMVIFEMILSFWLLFKGLKPAGPNQPQVGVA